MGEVGNVHSIETFGTVDGPGIRYVMFLQGCPLRCKFCHNPDTWEKGQGSVMNSGQIIEEIRQYQSFYKSSGGGVTASGGEPTLQPEFVEAVFSGVREIGLNTALDTSGFVKPDKTESLLALTDLVILDIKEISKEAHMSLAGVDNALIKNFAREVEKRRIPMWIRHVIIPGITGSIESLRLLGEFLGQFTMVERVEILGYHKMGSHKWELKGCSDPLADIPAASTQEVEKAKDTLRAMGIKNVL